MNTEKIEKIEIVPAGCVTIRLAAAMTGLSENAIRQKIKEGKWIEGREYFRSPDGGIFISIKGYEKWVQQGGVSRSTAKRSA